MHNHTRSSTSQRAARGARLAISLSIVALVLAACGSSSKSGSPTTQALSAGVSNASSTSTPSATASPTTAAAASPSTTATQSALVLPLCKMLKQSTVVQVLGSGAGTCQDFAPEGTAGRCLWGKLGTTTNTVQLTAFTGTTLATRKIGWTMGFPAVSGAGQGAWSRGPLKLGAETNVVLYVDYGSFGMEFAVTAPNATTAMAVTLAQSIG